jgi:lipopolysaccharide transport system ATP-binding protein
LRDVSFEIGEGEVVGVIGRNGAGKSTLLKILSRITEPTEGRVELHGRVGSLLEVGTGFHQELTGRENIYLNGAILGMRKVEIERKFDEIVSFAEVEKFIDTPVKHFSSGMYLRLAFAVAAHLDPEILLVDEVLAVGDAEFQKKCLGKMGEVARAGRTVLFVSHNMAAVQSLTVRCLWLHQGQFAALNTTNSVIEQYLAESSTISPGRLANMEYYRRDKGSSSGVRISQVGIDRLGKFFPQLPLGTDFFTVVMEVQTERTLHGANLTIIIKDALGRNVALAFSWDHGFRLDLPPGRHAVVAHMRDLRLAPGAYYADFGVNQSTDTTAFDVLLNVPLFHVVNTADPLYWPGRPWGCIHPQNVEWKLSPS